MAYVTDVQFLQHVDIVREEFKNRQILLSGTGVPNLAAPVGAYYLDVATNDRYEKIGPLNSDWQLYLAESAQQQWQPISGNVTATVDQKLLISTISGPITITLPATADVGDVIWFADASSTFGINNLILDGNGLNIMGSTDDFIVNVSDVLFIIMYTNTVGWKIFSFSD